MTTIDRAARDAAFGGLLILVAFLIPIPGSHRLWPSIRAAMAAMKGV